MSFESDLQNWHFVDKADYVHFMHTQATFLTNFFKNDIIKANGKNNNSSDDPSLLFASLMITIKVFSDPSATPWNQIAFEKSPTTNSASNYEAFEGSACFSIMPTLLKGISLFRSLQ